MGCASSAPGRAEAPDARPAPRPAARQTSGPGGRTVAHTEFHSDYVLGRKLGEGAFASVYSARREHCGREFAVKVIDPRAEDAEGRRVEAIDAKRLRAIEREVAVSQRLPRSAHIVESYDFYIGEGLSYFVMERCDMGLLPYLESVQALTEAALKPVFEDMASALAVCHRAGVVHRDVKCDNFLVSTGRAQRGFTVKLCDFGLAAAPGSGQLTGVCGTPVYMAPEMLRGDRYGASVDVWAFGVIVYVLLFGAWPYMPATPTGAAVKAAIREGTPAPEFAGQEISADCAAWSRALLCRDPAGRPSAEEALVAGSFRRRWSRATSLSGALQAAAGSGAFAAACSRSESSDLDRALSRLNAKCHPVSEASTSASGDSCSRLL